MEFKKDILELLKQCIENSAVNMDSNGKRLRKITLQENVEDDAPKFNQIVKVIDSGNYAVETLYSYEKFIEIFDRHGFAGFVS